MTKLDAANRHEACRHRSPHGLDLTVSSLKLARSGVGGDHAGRMALHEFLGHFVSAAVAADERYVRPRDASAIREGIDVWEAARDQRRAGRRGRPRSSSTPSSRVAALYARRNAPGDVSAALRAARRGAALPRPWFVCGPAGADVAGGLSARALPGAGRVRRISTRRSRSGRGCSTPTPARSPPPTSAARCSRAAARTTSEGRRLLGSPRPRCRATIRRGATSSSPCGPRLRPATVDRRDDPETVRYP